MNVGTEFIYEKMQSRSIPFIISEDMSTFEVDFEIVNCVEKQDDNCSWDKDVEQQEVVLSAQHFFSQALKYGKYFAHAVAIEIDGKAFVFIAPPSGGKSTLAKYWKELMPKSTRILADDHPVIGIKDSCVYVWNSPWSKCSDFEKSVAYPLNGICCINKSDENRMEVVDRDKFISSVLAQYPSFVDREKLKVVLETIVNDVPVYDLYCRNDISSAIFSVNKLVGGDQSL